MKIVLKKHVCYTSVGDLIPKAPIIQGRLAYRKHSIAVKALIDIGCDVTLVKQEKVVELEDCFGGKINFPVKRMLNFRQNGRDIVEKCLYLSFFFPHAGTDEHYSSDFGFLVPSVMEFDIADIWLGRDLLNYLKVTFDGVNESVTIIDPQVQRSRRTR